MFNRTLERDAWLVCAFRTLLAVACLSWFAAIAAADGKPPAKTDSEPGGKSAADAPAAEGEHQPLVKLNWQEGPGVGKLGTLAEVKIPAGFEFLNGEDTIQFLNALQNPTNGSELGTLMPSDGGWFLIFEFSNIGYVKDDEGASLDADAILKSLRAGAEQSNAERRRRGWPTMEIAGWQEKPHYDAKTHNVEWGIRGASDKHVSINYNIRMLGRGGVMAATLVAGPERMAAALPEMKTLLAGFGYTDGNKYSEFRPGDHVAEIGLTALVAGGGLAMAAKSGLLAKLGILIAKGWKLLVLAFVAVGAGIKKLFTGRQSTT